MLYQQERVYGHRRASTETQKMKGYGLQEQENTVRAYCERHGYQIVDFIQEDAISGNLHIWEELKDKRPLLISKIKEMSDQGITKLVTKSVDRLWRSDDAHIFIRRLFYQYGIELISINEPEYKLVEQNPEKKFKNNIDGVLATYERDKVAKRLYDGRKTKARTGKKPCGRTPYGYHFSPDTKNIEVIQEEKQVVELIFSSRYRDGKSLNQICDRLNQQGYRTRTNKDWTKQTINHMLSNPFYFGVITHGDDMAIKGSHEVFDGVERSVHIQSDETSLEVISRGNVILRVEMSY